MYPSTNMSSTSVICMLALLLSVCCAESPPTLSPSNESQQAYGELQSHAPLQPVSQNHSRCRHGGRGLEYEQLMWDYAIYFLIFIALAPFFILILLPIRQKRGSENFLRVMLAFALGKRLIDVLPLLFPYEYHEGEYVVKDGAQYGRVSVLLGFFAFFMAEKLILFIKGLTCKDHLHKEALTVVCSDDRKQTPDGTKLEAEGDSAKSNTQQFETAVPIEVGAILNLAAYFAHNFCLGLAVGATTHSAFTAGLIMSAVIAFHKIPHDFGDFALLVQNGMAKRWALCSQLLTNVGLFAGAGLAHEVRGVAPALWALPSISGGFLYLAIAAALPELLKDFRIWQKVKEVAALLFGLSFTLTG